MNNNNQFEFIIQYLKKENINIDFKEFKFQIETHPDFPSLLSFSEALDFFRIENVAAKISKKQLDQLPDNFVALLQTKNKGQFLSFVERQGDNFRYSTEKSKQTVSKAEFLDVWQEIILIVEKTAETKTNKPKTNILLRLLVTLFSFLFITSIEVINLFNFKMVVVLILILLGVYLAIEALKQEFGVKSSFSAAFCGSNNTSYQSNCESVITSKKAKLFSNFGLSDLGIIFFTGHLLAYYLMVISNYTQNFITLSFLVLLPAVPVTFYSLYFQRFIEKKWCTICLMIIAVLYVELPIFSFYSNYNFKELSLFSISIFLLAFISSLLIWFVVKPFITNYFKLKSSEITSIRFKRSYKLFKLALKDSRKIEYTSLKSVLCIGNPDAKIKISIVTNPFCGYCTEAHKILDALLQRFSDQVQLNIRFNFNQEHANNDSKLLHYRLVQIYFEKGAVMFMKALSNWFETKDLNRWFNVFGKGEINIETEQILTNQTKQNQNNKLTFTPALIVGEFLFPKMYDRSDLVNFISELADDEDFLVDNYKNKI